MAILQAITKLIATKKTAQSLQKNLHLQQLDILQMGLNNLTEEIGNVINQGINQVFSPIDRYLSEIFEPISEMQKTAKEMGKTAFDRDDIEKQVERDFEMSKDIQEKITQGTEFLNNEINLLGFFQHDGTNYKAQIEQQDENRKLHGD